ASPARGAWPRLPAADILIATAPFPPAVPTVAVRVPSGSAVAPRASQRVPARALPSVAASPARGVWTRLPASDILIASEPFPPTVAACVPTFGAVAPPAPPPLPLRAPLPISASPARGAWPRLPASDILIATEPFPTAVPNVAVRVPTGSA